MMVHPFFFLSGGSLGSTASSRRTHSAMSGRSLAAGAQHCCTRAFSSGGSFLPHLGQADSCSEPRFWDQVDVRLGLIRGRVAQGQSWIGWSTTSGARHARLGNVRGLDVLTATDSASAQKALRSIT